MEERGRSTIAIHMAMELQLTYHIFAVKLNKNVFLVMINSIELHIHYNGNSTIKAYQQHIMDFCYFENTHKRKRCTFTLAYVEFV